jgi:Family of unknown function (DUF6516)
MKAKLIFSKKTAQGGYIQEQVVWLLDKPVAGCHHQFKYRLYFGTEDGRCLVRYDNERGKGDHKHLIGIEHLYTFTSLKSVFTDFVTDVDSLLLNEKREHERL